MNILTIREMPEDVMKGVIRSAIELKRENNRARTDLEGKVLISLYEKPSTRTRLSFETAIANLGGQSIVMDFKSSQLSRGETMADTARVLSRYGHIVSARLFKHADLVELAKWATVPVINALTDLEHPCQALADMQTIIEHGKEGGKVVFMGDAVNNVSVSLMYVTARHGMKVVLCGPKGYLPKTELIEELWKSGASVQVTSDPISAAKDADVIYTDVWVSMGEESKFQERLRLLRPYQVSMDLMRQTGNLDGGRVIFLHCLPAFHDFGTEVTRDIGPMEVTDEVFEAPFSKVFDEAENRVHTIKAVMVATLA
jgi:ornithine carbamoyltransferase